MATNYLAAQLRSVAAMVDELDPHDMPRVALLVRFTVIADRPEYAHQAVELLAERLLGERTHRHAGTGDLSIEVRPR